VPATSTADSVGKARRGRPPASAVASEVESAEPASTTGCIEKPGRRLSHLDGKDGRTTKLVA
jgi:hypothetical protein